MPSYWGYRGSIETDIDGVDWDLLEQHFERAFDDGMDQLSEEIEYTWRRIAGVELNESREKYFEGFSVERVGGDILVKLEGWLPVALELGSPSFDLRPGFLGNGQQSRVIPMGFPAINRYRTITQGSNKSHMLQTDWHHPGFDKSFAIGPKVQQKVEDQILHDVFDRVISGIKL